MAGKLTATGIRNLATPGKYGDANGLFLIVAASGAKRWAQRLTIRGKRCDLGLGSLQDVSLAEAREIAASNRKAARSGQDPLQARREARAVPTFEEAALEVHKLHQPTWRTAKHAQEFLRTLNAHAFPKLGAKRVSEIATSDVLDVLSPIWTTQNATASRVRQRMGLVLKWSVAKGWRQDNPAGEAISEALPKVRREPVPRKAMPYTEVHGFISDLMASAAGWQTKLAIEFLILTASRSGQVRGMHWGEVDMAEKLWSLPPDRMKGNRAHIVPLSGRAMEILEFSRAITGGSGLVFPGRAGHPLADATLSRFMIRHARNACPHGFRTSFRTWVQDRTNFPGEVAEAALSHLNGDQTERAYARSNLIEKRRKLMDAWAGYLANDPAGKVVRIA